MSFRLNYRKKQIPNIPQKELKNQIENTDDLDKIINTLKTATPENEVEKQKPLYTIHQKCLLINPNTILNDTYKTIAFFPFKGSLDSITLCLNLNHVCKFRLVEKQHNITLRESEMTEKGISVLVWDTFNFLPEDISVFEVQGMYLESDDDCISDSEVLAVEIIM